MRVLVVDDSALMRNILKQMLAAFPDVEVVGEASNGQQAVQQCMMLQPDVITMDINMPVMSGLDATRAIMKERPTPIVIFSSAVDAGIGFDAVSAGAFDVIRKPDIDEINGDEFRGVFRARLAAAGLAAAGVAGASRAGASATPSRSRRETVARTTAVVIGASTGGPVAVREVLRLLPSGFPAAVALVQHLEQGFDKGYVRWLAESTALTVDLVGSRELMSPGCVFVAPANKHLRVEGGYVVLDDGPPVLNQKPSVDVLFSSAAAAYRDLLTGVLLTGMGRDGAAGCLRIMESGGRTLVQDRSTSTIFGMPKAAIEAGGASEVLPLAEIPRRLLQLVGPGVATGRA